MPNLDCDQDQIKLDEMSNEKLTKSVANRVTVICPLRIEVIWVIWKCNFDVFGSGFRSQKVQNWEVKSNGVFGTRNEGKGRGTIFVCRPP